MEVLLLALVRFSSGDIACLDFGRPLEPTLTTEERVRGILADFDRRKFELLDIGFSKAVPTLVHILEASGTNPSAIIPAIRALGYLGRPQGAEAVARHIHHPDARVRLAAIRSLGQMGKFETVPLVEAYLTSNDHAERREAIVALGKFAKPELIPEIERAAGSDGELLQLVDEARWRIGATITAIRTNDFREFVETLIRTDEYEDILPLFMFAWRPVLSILGDTSSSAQLRWRALELVWAARARRASEHLYKILADPSQPADVRLLAVETFGRIAARSAVERLIELMNSPEPRMLETCIDALGRIGDPRALTPLLERWDERAGSLRDRLRLALSRLCSRSRSGVDALLEPLKTYQPREVAEVIIITEANAVIRGYRHGMIDTELMAASVEARRDATLLLATFGTKADFDTLMQIANSDSDPLIGQIAALGAERLKDIPLWERP